MCIFSEPHERGSLLNKRSIGRINELMLRISPAVVLKPPVITLATFCCTEQSLFKNFTELHIFYTLEGHIANFCTVGESWNGYCIVQLLGP